MSEYFKQNSKYQAKWDLQNSDAIISYDANAFH